VKLQAPTLDLTAAIQRHIANYAAACDSPYHQLAKQHGVLGLYLGWGTDFGLAPDGTVRRFSSNFPVNGYDVWYGDSARDVSAVAFGALRHPELRAMFPTRPPNAVDCESCDGAGILTLKDSTVICACHGMGWREAEPKEA
jgi:hypothetical protein